MLKWLPKKKKKNWVGKNGRKEKTNWYSAQSYNNLVHGGIDDW